MSILSLHDSNFPVRSIVIVTVLKNGLKEETPPRNILRPLPDAPLGGTIFYERIIVLDGGVISK